MKKIMFNDRYGLTKAVLDGRKTQTRRIVNNSPYNVGEIVAVAQPYKDCGYDPDLLQRGGCPEKGNLGDYAISELPGWKNKMFVFSEMMPHQIRITRVWVERLQDISDEDCIKEGILKDKFLGKTDEYGYGEIEDGYFFDCSKKDDCYMVLNTPREAYAALIDKVSGKGTWENNPYVFCYEFELIK